MSDLWGALGRTPFNRFGFWKYHWIVHHRIHAALKRARPLAKGLLVDVGSGSKPHVAWFRGAVAKHVGFDLPDYTAIAAGTARPDVFARAEALPLRDGAADTYLAINMLNYLPDPFRALEEARRVVTPGGVAIVEFAHVVTLIDGVDDYLRFTPHAARVYLERHGFEPLELVPIGGFWTHAALHLTAPLNRINRGPTRVLTEIPVRVLYVVIQLGAALLERVFWNPRDVLGVVAIARRRDDARGAQGAAGPAAGAGAPARP